MGMMRKFLVSGGLTIQNIDFDSLDSIIPLEEDSAGCLAKKIQCCTKLADDSIYSNTSTPCLNNGKLWKPM